MSNESENEKKNAAIYEQIKKENYEKLDKAIELLNSHTVMVGSIVIAESYDRFNQLRPSRLLNKEERESLTNAMGLLIEIRKDMAVAEDVKAGHVVLGVNAPYTGL